jgi:hypothetical protein
MRGIAKEMRDLSGDRYGRWTVLSFSHRAPRKYWSCRCECGTEKTVSESSLRSGSSKSCGCLKNEMTRERLVKRNTTHGLSKTPAFRIWDGMKQRCLNPNSQFYSYYGGRGITVCEDWLSFENFYADMGDPPTGLSLDRVDNDGPYAPWNCRWTDDFAQVKNRRKRPKSEPWKELGISRSTWYRRRPK